MKHILLSILLYANCIVIQAQNNNISKKETDSSSIGIRERYREECFKSSFKDSNILFNGSANFTAMKPQPPYIFIYTNSELSSSFFFASENRQVLIGIASDAITKTAEDYIRKFHPDANFNNSYKNKIKSHREASAKHGKLSKIKYYTKKKTNILNAQVAGEFVYNEKVPFIDDYRYCKVRFMHTDYLKDVFIYYFFISDNKRTVKKIMKQTFDIVTFKENLDTPRL